MSVMLLRERGDGKIQSRHREGLAVVYVRQSSRQQGQYRAPGRPYLLGLKGTMTEVELHLIKQRMASGQLAKASRGELAFPLPAGYVRRSSGEVALDPDEQVQAVIRLVFHLFEQMGTVHAVLRFLVGCCHVVGGVIV
ncbi:hypothetical protein ACIBCO_40860 [Streptomyces violascens]|uniref:hypothetical protein n=1 Tax=Streptomyces violascens TaxID=67381 RepID=UPI0037898080